MSGTNYATGRNAVTVDLTARHRRGPLPVEPHQAVERVAAFTPLRWLPGIGWRPSWHYGPFNTVKDQPEDEWDRPYWKHDVQYGKIQGAQKYTKWSAADQRLVSDVRKRFANRDIHEQYDGITGKLKFIGDLVALGFFSLKKWIGDRLDDDPTVDRDTVDPNDAPPPDAGGGVPGVARTATKINSRVHYERDN